MNRRQSGLGLVLVFDELSKFVSKESARRTDLREPYLLEVLRTSRKKGVGVILADQTYAQFHDVIRSNCQTKIVFETIDGPSRFEIMRDMSISREDEPLLSQLSFLSEKRTVLVQVPYYPRPFLVEVPHFEPPNRTANRQSPELHWIPLQSAPDAAKPDEADADVTHEMEAYLGVIGSHPFHQVTDYDEMTKKPQARGTKLRKALIGAGMLEEHEINTHKQGGQSKVVVPTQKGYELMDGKRIPYKIPPGNGSIPHRFWQYTIARKLRSEGWRTWVEESLVSKRVDVGATKGRIRVAYEVSLEPLEKELVNLEKDLADGWGRVVFCVETQEIRERLSEMLPDSEDRIEVRLLRDFL